MLPALHSNISLIANCRHPSRLKGEQARSKASRRAAVCIKRSVSAILVPLSEHVCEMSARCIYLHGRGLFIPKEALARRICLHMLASRATRYTYYTDCQQMPLGICNIPKQGLARKARCIPPKALTRWNVSVCMYQSAILVLPDIQSMSTRCLQGVYLYLKWN